MESSPSFADTFGGGTTESDVNLFQLFGEAGASVLLEHLSIGDSVKPDLKSAVARERKAHAQDEFEACFGTEVAYDPALKDEYGKRPWLLQELEPSKISEDDGTMQLVRLPVVHPQRQILHVDLEPFDAKTEAPRQSTFRDLYTPENVIRRKEVDGKMMSNATVTKWSNGETTVTIGNDVYILADVDTSNDLQVVAERKLLREVTPLGSPDGKEVMSYQTVPQDTPKALRLLTPLNESSIGEYLSKEQEQQTSSNRLEHVMPRAPQPTFAASSRINTDDNFFDPDEHLVTDVMAQKHETSIEALQTTILTELDAIEQAAANLGVIDREDVLTECTALRNVSRSNTQNDLLRVKEQCSTIRRMYRI